jgi:plasmid maintenance system killer protein
MYNKFQAMKTKQKDKELRRQVEILKAQVSSSKAVYIPTQNHSALKKEESNHTVMHVDTNLVKKDLLKTILISMLAFSIIFTLKII